MKWHLIAVILIIAALFPAEILAKPPTYRSRKYKSSFKNAKSKNNPANRRPVSTGVTPYNPQTSRFGSVPSAGASQHATTPATSSPSVSSRFARLGLSSGSLRTRNPTSSAQSGNPSTSTGSGRPKTTYRKRLSSLSNTASQQPSSVNQPSTSGRTSGGTSGPRVLVRKRHRPPRPTLQQMRQSALNSLPSTPVINPPPLVQNPQANPPPLPPFRLPTHTPYYTPPVIPPPAPVNNPAPAPVNNPAPGPSFQPPAPAALVQAGSAPAPGSRAAAKAQKALAKQNRIAKNQVNAQSTLQQINANAGTCKDPTAPPDKCFDFYVLAVSWGPTMKIRRLGNAAPINKPEWGVHGLWPSLNTYNRLPKSCDLPIPFDPNQISAIQDTLEDRWFSVNGSPMDHLTFLKHEWNKHGVCAARSPQIKNVQGYFQKGLELFNQANVQAKLSSGNFRPKKEMTNKDMHNEISRILGHTVTLEPILNPKTKDSWLSEIRLCYNFNFHIINCPPDHKTLNAQNEDAKMIYSL